MFKVVRKSGNISLWRVQFLSRVIRGDVQVTEEAVKQACRKYKFTRSPEELPPNAIEHFTVAYGKRLEEH